MKSIKSNIIVLLAIFLAAPFIQSCQKSGTENEAENNSKEKKIAVLLVNHGSHFPTWRNALLNLEKNVEQSILALDGVEDVKTAFMEYTEPSIATRLKELDKENFTDVVIVPIFLTVSPHSFDDIPTIIGKKEDTHSLEMLKLEKIERYTPKAKTHITPLLDFTDILKKNVLRRTKVLSKKPEQESLVLIGYGDETYETEWVELFDNVADYVKEETGIDEYSYGWCGHIAHYKSSETTAAINKTLKNKENAIVIPVLVAHDEMFQIKIIGGGIDKIEDHENKVYYKPDAILPDKNIEQWVIDISKEYVQKVKSGKIDMENKITVSE